MHRDKITSGAVALVLGALLIGGTFAWLGSSDNVANIFSTKGPNDFSQDVDIWEKFEQESTAEAGKPVEKIVQVKNDAGYNSLIRVTMEASFDETKLDETVLDNSKIELNKANIISESDITFNEDGTIANGEGKWVEITEEGQTYYYYIGNVVAGGFTDKILDSVTLSGSVATDPNYIGKGFEVNIEAYSVQSTAEAITDKTDGKEAFGASGDQLGFGLDESVHSNLVKALKAVVAKEATSCTTDYGTSATVKTGE